MHKLTFTIWYVNNTYFYPILLVMVDQAYSLVELLHLYCHIYTVMIRYTMQKVINFLFFIANILINNVIMYHWMGEGQECGEEVLGDSKCGKLTALI